jgi:DNA helicase-2/ATP-dependent DNA helicase PcrA
MHRDVLERTGMRAALAYLRIATADGRPAGDDIVEILRRPTRGLPTWFPERLARRSTWSLDQLAQVADQVPDKEVRKVLQLADDLAVVIESGGHGSTRHVLEAVRDEVGLGTAMSLLDRTGGGQGSSHLDDLEGLLGVADLHPDPRGFESWLRQALSAANDPSGVTLATIHRVKGREYDRVIVFGVTEGVMPHRLADDVEEERRVLHVGITRGRHRVTVLADRTRPSPFLAELAGTAPRSAPPPPAPESRRASERAPRTSPAGADGVEAVRGRLVAVPGGFDATVEEVDAAGATVRLESGATMRVRFGERVTHDGRRAPLRPPDELWGAAADAESALRDWRSQRARSDGVPAYVVVHDRHLRAIALARPRTPTELIACDGIGPAKLERYGDDILRVLEPFVDAS